MKEEGEQVSSTAEIKEKCCRMLFAKFTREIYAVLKNCSTF